MAYQATVIPVMIASPGDVFEEREVVREVINTWNYIHSFKAKVVLMAAGWETHSSPELGARPQELINSRVLKECDLLIGVFWTRIGSPTGTSHSGTVEEIEEHVKAGKPAMIYFSSRPVAPESVDADQFAAVQAFKTKCKSLGLIESYDNIVDFKDKVSRHLQISIHNSPHIQTLLQHAGGLEVGAFFSGRPSKAEQPYDYLSEEARVLLKTASRDKNGMIIKAAVIGGRFIQAGGQTFGGGGGRESAVWEHALNELIEHDLVLARGHKGEIFELTHDGWRVADALPE